jgi:hypothetical protein
MDLYTLNVLYSNMTSIILVSRWLQIQDYHYRTRYRKVHAEQGMLVVFKLCYRIHATSLLRSTKPMDSGLHSVSML